MSLDRVGALATGHSANVTYLTQLSEADWATPSRCEVGRSRTSSRTWPRPTTARHAVVPKLMLGKDVEAANDRDVAKRQEWPPGRSSTSTLVGAPVTSDGRGTTKSGPLRSLRSGGPKWASYPAAVLTSAFVFDHTLHVTYSSPRTRASHRQAGRQHGGGGIELDDARWPAMSGGKLSWLQAPLS